MSFSKLLKTILRKDIPDGLFLPSWIRILVYFIILFLFSTYAGPEAPQWLVWSFVLLMFIIIPVSYAFLLEALDKKDEEIKRLELFERIVWVLNGGKMISPEAWSMLEKKGLLPRAGFKELQGQ